MENKTLSAEPLLLLIWKNRKLFVITGIIAVALSSVASFLIPVKFKAVCSVFPAKSSSLPIGDKILPPHGTELFGEEEEGEQMLAILGSSPVVNHIISKFDLYKHYDIDVNSSSKNDLMAAAIKEHIKYERTRHGSVDITVWDADPKMCAAIANEIANEFDRAKNKMIAENASQNYKAMESQYASMMDEVKQIEDTMTKLRMMGVVGEEEALAALLERQTIALQKGGAFAEEVNRQVENNQKYGSVYFGYYSRLGFIEKRVEILKGNLAQLKADAEAPMSYKYFVDRATPPDKKAYPIRWLVVVVSTVSSLFFLLTLLVVLQKIKQLKTVA